MPLVIPPTRDVIVALAGQTVFNYTFEDTGAVVSGIIVNTLAVGATTKVERVILVDYTLDRDTKAITFLVAPGVDVVVEIERATNRTRDVKHSPASTVTGAILNRDEEQSFRFKQELEDEQSRKLGLSDREEHFTAKLNGVDRKIIDLADAVDSLDAMNLRSVQSVISTSGNVPSPGVPGIGQVLTGLTSTTFGFRDRGVPVADTSDSGFILTVDGGGEGGYSFRNRGVPIPDTSDLGQILTVDFAAEGGYSFRARGVPIPDSGDLNKALQVTGAGGEGGYEFGAALPRPASGDVGKGLLVSAADAYQLQDLTPAVNWVYNSDFSVAQRGTVFTSTTVPINNNDMWLLDRWLFLSERAANSADVSQELTIIPDGAYASIKLEYENANDQIGIVQIYEARDTKRMLRDGTSTVVSLSFEARTTTGAAISNLRATVLAWTGPSEDVVTSDLVGTWNPTGSDFTPAANWTIEKAGVNLPIVDNNTFQRFTVDNIALDTAGTKNLALIIWVDDDNSAIGDVIYISKVKLERGPITTPYQAPHFASELADARRYLFVLAPGATGIPVGSGFANGTSSSHKVWLPTKLRGTPIFSISAGAHFIVRIGPSSAATTTVTQGAIGNDQFVKLNATHANLTAGSGAILETNNTLAKVTWDSEL